jgi:hypothetical protein
MLTLRTKWFLDRPHVIKQLGKGKAKALRQVGAMVYRSVQGTFASGRPSQNGTNRQIGTFNGLPLIERRKRPAKSGRITSWRTARNPKGFIRSAMAFAYDPSSQSVLIGPRQMQSPYSSTLFQLHEKGGSQTQRLYLRFRGRPIPRQRAFGLKRTGSAFNLAYVGTFMAPRPRTSNFLATSRARTVRVPPSRYQLGGLNKVINKIPSKFRGQISGP